MKTAVRCTVAIALLTAIVGCDKNVHEVLGPRLGPDHVAMAPDDSAPTPDRSIVTADEPGK